MMRINQVDNQHLDTFSPGEFQDPKEVLYPIEPYVEISPLKKTLP